MIAVWWAYGVFGAVLAIGLAVLVRRGDWQQAQGLDTLLLLGPIFYAAPVAAFGTEHFTLSSSMVSMVPHWIPGHLFWLYFVGGCFIAGALSLVTGIQARLAASLFALTFFLFVVLMDAPGWAHHLDNRFAAALTLRELSFSGGALALAASLNGAWRDRGRRALATVARYCVGVPVLFYAFEQLRHAHHVPGIPLELVTPVWIVGHAFWTYFAGAVYVVAGLYLLAGRKTRAAATWIAATVLVVELAVYVPFAVAERASLVGFNYLADTLMYGGAVLLLAGAMPREE
ncbi:MAG: DoxX family membrane protein [Acidobacteriota bacterium]|nr:DoxX family membrane protein [Acidobacteriota bacterium]